jgi:hypothetical protein
MGILAYRMFLNGNSAIELTWTGTGWVYVNGNYVCGPETDGCVIPYQFTDTNAIEVHDEQTDLAINEIPATRPLIRWTKALNSVADLYNIYHTPKDGTRELIISYPDNGTDTIYTAQVQDDLVDGWHFFEVTSYYSGTETTVDAFPYRVMALPLCADNIEAADGSGSGLFDITVTPGA